ncbi:MAG TPA: hypothetical protein VM869_29860 [Enhygromyxa sp.]|nr:hypothetical protein [Enhygromyxa sp.]
MTQLDDFTRRALCAADQPPPGVEDRILAAILGPIGGPGPDGGGGGGGLSSGAGPGSAVVGHSTIAYAIKIVGATLGLAAGGLALLTATAAGVRSISDSSPSRASAPMIAAAEPVEAPATVAALSPEPEPPDDAPVLAEPEPAPTIASAPAQRPSKPPTTAPEDTIEAELALMKVARGSKDHELALATLDRHRREFATGVFAAEREVLRVEHLCALGRVDEAQTVANAFIARHPKNPLRSRVDPACDN